MKIKAAIEGITPLLMNNYSLNELSTDEEFLKHLQKDVEASAYRTKKGELYIPGACILSVLCERGVRCHRQRYCRHDEVDILTKECLLGVKDYSVHAKEVTVPSTGKRVMRRLPKIENWKTVFVLEIGHCQPDVKNALISGGEKTGLLANRPRYKGTYGKFNVIGWEVVEK